MLAGSHGGYLVVDRAVIRYLLMRVLMMSVNNVDLQKTQQYCGSYYATTKRCIGAVNRGLEGSDIDCLR